MSHVYHPLAGIALVIAACACFSAHDTAAKYVSATLPLLMMLWFRYAFQAIATTVVVMPMRGMRVWRTQHPKFQALRGVILLTGSLFGLASLKYMPIGEFTAIVAIAQPVVTVLAATVLKEKVSPLRWGLVAGGFIGTLVIIRPGADTFHWATLLPLGSVGTYAWFQVLTSRLARTEDPVTMHLYTGWVGMVMASLALPFVWVNLPSLFLWGLLCFMGIAASIGHFLLILAFQRSPAATVSPYLYTQIAFATMAGLIMFSHVPDGWSLIGMAMIALCGCIGAWLSLRESRVKLQPIEV